MKFDKDQEVICVDNLNIIRSLVVGDSYVVEKFFPDTQMCRIPMVKIEGIDMHLSANRFMNHNNPNILEITRLHHEISVLDDDIEESHIIETQTGDDLFWKREQLRGKIDDIIMRIEMLREEK